MGIREEIKSYIVRSGMTMTEVMDRLYDDYDWSRSVANLSGKLRRGSLRYQEAVELADVLDYDIVPPYRLRLSQTQGGAGRGIGSTPRAHKGEVRQQSRY